MATLEEVLAILKAAARPDRLEGMARYGMSTDQRFGISVPKMRSMAKELGKDHELARTLWRTGSAEARIIAAMIDEPELVTVEQMEEWVRDIDSWDVCDQVCMSLFEKTPFALEKIREWSEREQEFVKRAAFALIACLAFHDRKATDGLFIGFFPLIRHAATDERNYVKKGVSWALRHIGKRSITLNRAALAFARELREVDSRAARWIAAGAIRELESDAVQRRLQKK
jgi:3-methyladenine DNA glycosylase AlkD